MFCRKCGSVNDDNAFKCVQCGEILQQIQQQGEPAPKVSNYLVPAILTTLFCCLPFGIVAIVYAAQVNSKIAAGDYAGAVETSRKAKIWCWVSFGLGFAASALWFIIAMLGAILGATAEM